MPVTIKRNRFPAQLQTGGGQNRFLERIHVHGLTVTAGNEQEVLFEAQQAIVAAVAGGIPGHPEYGLERIILDSVAFDSAAGLLHWSIQGFGGTPTSSVITESTVLVSRSTNMALGTREPFRIPDTADGVKGDNVTFNVLMPHRIVNVATLGVGEVPEDQGEKVCHVNNAPWRGLPTGYWIVSEHTISVSRYEGRYQKRISAMSRVLEDWSETGILRDASGKYVEVSGATIDGINAVAYVHGLISTTDAGAGRWGPFPTTDFPSFFGF